ncbi:MAG TPA: hypothetical protein VNM69_22440 [Bacillus sp. (in: firmicutes)]|nr:hypothetical protein [Bacillus litorisediminis]HWO78630.1 hypothetical protein [Bacillus sp. (in: firmicutes)]
MAFLVAVVAVVVLTVSVVLAASFSVLAVLTALTALGVSAVTAVGANNISKNKMVSLSIVSTPVTQGAFHLGPELKRLNGVF